MSAAIMAASIASVPEPHIGSRNSVACRDFSGQPARIRMPAARFSRNGAAASRAR